LIGLFIGFVLKTCFHEDFHQNLALAFSVKKSNDGTVLLRAIVQGLLRDELKKIKAVAEPSKSQEALSHLAIITDLISMLLNDSAEKTSRAILRVETQKDPSSGETNKANLSVEEYDRFQEEMSHARLYLENLRSGTQHILHLLNRIESDDHFKADSQPNGHSKSNLRPKYIAGNRQYEIERSLNKIDKLLYAVALKAIINAGVDSSSMKLISILTMAFLPATFAAVSIRQVLDRTV
jgi:hypothetical protein